MRARKSSIDWFWDWPSSVLKNDHLGDTMQIGYMRVSKADRSQSTDLQRDALRAAGVATRRLSMRTAPPAASMPVPGSTLP
jgi:hypothetical protein